MLSQKAHHILAEDVRYTRIERMDDDSLRWEVLSLLDKRPLSNQEIRQLSGKTAQQVRKFMLTLADDGVEHVGKGRAAKYQKKA